MPITISRRTLCIAAMAAGFLVLLLGSLALWPTPVLRPVDLQIAGPPQFTNGVLVVRTVLSNGTACLLNVVDDTAGNPHFILDAGAECYPGGSGDHVVRLGPMGNTLRISLAPGASLTNSVSVTNPPSRFRLRAEVRDLAVERRRWWVGPLIRMLPQRWSEKLNRPLDRPMPTSAWIDFKMPEN